jgi:hypothetical protein
MGDVIKLVTRRQLAGVVYVAAGSRQKRFERKDNPPPIDVANDHRLFQVLYWLLRLRFLETKQIARLLYQPGSRKYAERQLRALYDNGYVDRFPWPVERRWGKTRAQFGAVRAIHCLDERGARLLAGQLEVERKEVDWRPRDNRQPGNLEHTLALNDFLITAYLAAQAEGWTFEIVQTEREVNRQDGHDRVTDPATGRRVTVKPDSVCRLIFTPSRQGMYFSPELDMGTEGPKKIRAKVRAHVAHFKSGGYQKRHGTTSHRILFVVADVRDPRLARPLTEVEWRERVAGRCESLKGWIEDAVPGERRDLFWVAPAFALTGETVYQGRVWRRAGQRGAHALAE